jgi:hypothetical protein
MYSNGSWASLGQEPERLSEAALTGGRPWWEKTVEETACGVCDADHAGRGARALADPKLGYIVACKRCQREVQRRIDRDVERRVREGVERRRYEMRK